MANYNYCCLAYHGCGKTEARILEKMLKRALKFVYYDFTSSYNDLLSKANMSSLYVHRQRQLLTSVYKILNDELPPVPSNFYCMKSCNYQMRKQTIVQRNFQTMNYGFYSLHYQGALLWNSLPEEMKCLDFKDFKCQVYSYAFNCQCGSCFLCCIQNM